MSTLVDKAIESVVNGESAFYKFITANDVGETGSHQSGFYVPKDSYALFFDKPGCRGENKDNFIRIYWNEDFYTDSRAIYYGRKSRNEYRITKFGRGFPFTQEKYSGSLIVIVKIEDREYKAFILEQDDEIEKFLAFFDLSPVGEKHLITGKGDTNTLSKQSYIDYVISRHLEFPSTDLMSELAREIEINTTRFSDNDARRNPDKAILKWVNTEYQLFRAFEERDFLSHGNGHFDNCQSLIDFSNSLINRRKSRAGKSLEHHLSHIFRILDLRFEEQVITEGKKKPDFIFPDGISYHNMLFPADDLTLLGAKTTCKDRWRQVLNEADRIQNKHLFTLQPGISVNQLEEMYSENLTLVVPASNIETFDSRHQSKLMTLESFINLVREKQAKY